MIYPATLLFAFGEKEKEKIVTSRFFRRFIFFFRSTILNVRLTRVRTPDSCAESPKMAEFRPISTPSSRLFSFSPSLSFAHALHLSLPFAHFHVVRRRNAFYTKSNIETNVEARVTTFSTQCAMSPRLSRT